MKLLTLLFTIPLGFTSCSSTKNIAGKYVSYSKIQYFFGIELNLKSDSTFDYLMRGHISGDKATGRYEIAGRLITLNYVPTKVDIAHNTNNTGVVNLISDNSKLRPSCLYLAYKKLYNCDSTGKVIKKIRGLSRGKKYLLFGSRHLTTGKYYLKRLD
jgi:hypothetical protein